MEPNTRKYQANSVILIVREYCRNVKRGRAEIKGFLLCSVHIRTWGHGSDLKSNQRQRKNVFMNSECQHIYSE